MATSEVDDEYTHKLQIKIARSQISSFMYTYKDRIWLHYLHVESAYPSVSRYTCNYK